MSGYATAASMVISTATSYYNAQQADKEKKRQLRYQQEVAKINQSRAEENAKAIADAGRAEEQRTRLESAQRARFNRAKMGGWGIDLSSGTALDLQGDWDLLSHYDGLVVRDETIRRTNAALQQANNFSNEANLYALTANNVNTTRASLLSSASKAGSTWMSSYGGK